MKTKSASRYNSAPTLSIGIPVLALVALLVLAGGGSPVAAAAALRLTNTGANTEALPTCRLDWDATSNSTYLVQCATSLAPGATWSTLDAVFVPDKVGTYQLQVSATDSTGSVRPPATFYRLILPQPQITSVEPAIVPPGVSVDFYVLGQSFPTNATLQINGVTQSGTVYSNSTTLVQPSFTPDLAGNYQVSLVVGGVVVSSFTVVCADPLANPEQVLQGPPAIEPPASPVQKGVIPQAGARLLFPSIADTTARSKRGYDYYKAQSDLTAAGASSNPYFHNNEMSDDMPGLAKKDFKGHVTLLKAFDDGSDGESARTHTKTGHVTLMKAFDDGSDDSRARPGRGRPIQITVTREWNGDKTWRNFNAFSGEVQACSVDLAIPGRGLDFILARTYHSRLHHTATLLDSGWTLSYDVRCAQNSSGGLDVYDGTGRKDTFTPGTNGVYTCPEIFREGTLSNNTFTLTFADTGRWVFNPFDGTSTAGKLIQIITRNGDTMTLGYDTSGRLTQVVDDLGRTNTMSYNTGGQLASVTDFAGRTVTYQYYSGAKADNGGAGDLKSVTSPPVNGTPNGNDFPGGKTETYTYSKSFPLDRENHLLLTVTDPKGQTASVFTYGLSAADPTNYLHCLTAQAGTNTAYTYSWSLKQHPAGSQAQLNNPSESVPGFFKCIANDPVGNVTEAYFDARGRCVLEREFTGRATPGVPVTDTVNRPTGQVRSTDPAYYETQWAWNNDSLCTAEMAPGGEQMQFVYQSDFDPATPARKRADCRVVREIASSAVDLNGDGIPDVTSRAWYYTYDPRFGNDPTASRTWTITKNQQPVCARGIITSKPTGGTLGNTAAVAKDKSPICANFTLQPYGLATSGGIIVVKPGTGSTGSANHAINTKGTGGNTGIADAVTFGREKLKTKTKTQGDFNLANRFSFEIDGVISMTDPRGNVTTGTYDGTGNRVKVQFFWDRKSSAERDFAYDTHGQLTAITNAPDANGRSRVDTFTWSQGQLTQCVEDDGAGGLALTENYEYDARGNLTRYVDPRGNDSLFTYNALDQCVRAQSPPNISARCATDFAYDANDNLVTCTTQLRDAADNLVATPVDRASYDSLNQLTELALAIDASHALTNRFVYDGNGQCVQALGPDAVSGADPYQTVAYSYDERGLLFREAAASGSPLQFTTQCDYDANGLPTRVSEGLEGTPRITTLEYDGFVGNAASGGWTGFVAKSKGTLLRLNSFASIKSGGKELVKHLGLVNLSNSGRCSRVTDPMGNVTTFNYDANDNLKVLRQFGELNDVAGSAGNVRLAEARYEYDGLDRCFRAHDLFFNPATQSPIGSGDAVSSCVLAPNGDCVSVTDSLGRTTSFGYDTASRLSSATDARGNISVSVRDAMGNVTSVTKHNLTSDAPFDLFIARTFAYDHFNRCVSASDNVGNTFTCAYDSLDRVVRETNPNGNDTTYAYDLLDNCLATADYNGSSSGTKPIVVRTSHATYDSSARCLTSTDPNGNLTSYAYDSLGRCTTVVNADGTRLQKQWLPANFKTIETDPNGTTVTNLYDLCDRLIHRDIATGGAAVATTTFETFAYDGCDQLVLANNDVSSVSFSYDSFGDCTGSLQDGLAQSATYDREGNPLSLTYPGGRVVNYAYDVLDQVTNISTSANGVSHPQLARFAYAGPGRLAGIARDNGINTRGAWNGYINPANSSGDYGWQEVSRVRDGTVASPSLVCDVTGTYSPAQSKLTRADAGRTSLTLTYDALEQLVEASDSVSSRDTMYALDAAGNRSHVITNGVLMTPDYALSTALPPGDFLMNRYTTTPFGSQSYDANGNLMVRASAASPMFYHYDYADRLVEVDMVGTLGTLGPVATFTYDALGNRISKTTYPPSPAAPVTVQYVHKGATEQCDDGNNVIEERVGTSVTRAYCEMTAFTGTGAAQYYHCDDLGNVLALTDAGGNVLERYAYDDYGQPQFLDANGSPLVGSDGQPVTTSPLGNPLLFQGMEWDGETGLLGDGGGNYFDPLPASAIRGKVKVIKDMGGSSRAFEGNNPWSGGGGTEMKKGTVKFFNEAKGFGMAVGGGTTLSYTATKGKSGSASR